MTKHNHVTRDIKPEGECPSCDLYYENNKQRENIKKISDVILLVEFKRRFNGSVLYEVNSNVLLDSIGVERIKRFLREGFSLTTRKIKGASNE
jgi:hypothetical protein